MVFAGIPIHLSYASASSAYIPVPPSTTPPRKRARPCPHVSLSISIFRINNNSLRTDVESIRFVMECNARVRVQNMHGVYSDCAGNSRRPCAGLGGETHSSHTHTQRALFIFRLRIILTPHCVTDRTGGRGRLALMIDRRRR